MNFDKVIRKRASIKDYLNKKVSYDKIVDIIEAASLAPSPGNFPILKFVIVEEGEKINKISQACQQPFINKTRILVVVCSDSKQIDIMYDKRAGKYTKHHVGAAIENFLLKVTDLGLASCWVGAFSDSSIKNVLKIPDGVEVEAVLPIGYPLMTDKTKQRPKPDLGTILYFETYGNKYKNEVRKISNH